MNDLEPFKGKLSLNNLWFKFLEVATDAARAAGNIIRAAHGCVTRKHETKDGNSVNLVTATDLAVEEILRSAFLGSFPDFAFVSEESVIPGQKLKEIFKKKITILCDPVDGTTNLLHGFPFVCTSIALIVEGIPIVGVVYNPILNDMYIAVKGHGSWLNGNVRLHAQSNVVVKPILGNLLILAELGHDRSTSSIKAKLKTLEELVAGNIHGIRSTGSAACNLCLIARGSADAYLEIGIHAWDIAAGIVIVTEAGGMAVGAEYFTKDLANETNKSSQRSVDILGRKVAAIGYADSVLLQELLQRVVVIEDNLLCD